MLPDQLIRLDRTAVVVPAEVMRLRIYKERRDRTNRLEPLQPAQVFRPVELSPCQRLEPKVRHRARRLRRGLAHDGEPNWGAPIAMTNMRSDPVWAQHRMVQQ